jgi:phosphatidylinositol alpha-1,6-mannosyltransferase
MTPTEVMAPKTVLFFSFGYPPHDGGISRLCAELVMGLQRRGVGIRVLSQNRDGAGSCIPPARVERVTMRRPWRELAAFRELRRTGPNAAVICGIWYPEGLLATLAGVRSVVILAHGLELRPTRQRWRRGPWRRLMQLVLRRARLVVANSKYTAELVRRSADGTRVTALPLGVDHHRFCPGDRHSARRRFGVAEDKDVIVSVSRIHWYKGHRLVLRALAATPDVTRDRLLYLVAGQGPDLEPLQQEADALGLNGAVRFLGYVPEEDLSALYCSADLFVLCTREDHDHSEVEGFGLAFLEAQACGVPVVGTRTGGIPDAIEEGRGGWLIEQDDVEALTAILCRLVNSPGNFRLMGLIARQRVESECTWDHYVDSFVERLGIQGVSIC